MSVAARKSSDYSALLEKVKDIPTLPIVAKEINELINDPNSSSSEIAKVLKKDQVLTAKILRLANSSYYAIPGGCTDVQRALAFLGFNTLAQLVLGLSVFSMFSSLGEGEDCSMLDFWKHALGTAICSEIIAKRLKIRHTEDAFTCGLLHDIGKLALHEIDPGRLTEIIREAKKRNCSFIEVERDWDVPNHAFLGEVIATKWGLPQVIRLAIRYHHFDVTKMNTILESAKPIIQIVRLSNALCVKNAIGKSGDYSDGGLCDEMLKPLSLGTADVAEIEKQLKTEFEKAGAFLNVGR